MGDRRKSQRMTMVNELNTRLQKANDLRAEFDRSKADYLQHGSTNFETDIAGSNFEGLITQNFTDAMNALEAYNTWHDTYKNIINAFVD